MNKIFLIDDDEYDQLLFKEAIESINPLLKCDTATNGKMPLDKLKVSTSLPDLIFLDLNMPIMNGIDFFVQREKEEQLNKIPVVIFSTSNIISEKELAKELGARLVNEKILLDLVTVSASLCPRPRTKKAAFPKRLRGYGELYCDR